MRLTIQHAIEILPALVRRHVIGTGVIELRDVPTIHYSETDRLLRLDSNASYALIEGETLTHNVFGDEQDAGRAFVEIPSGSYAIGWIYSGRAKTATITHRK